MQIKKVGVIGAGLMGRGIAQVSAAAGFPTVLSEINDQFLKNGIDSIKGGLSKQVEKGKMKQADMDALLSRIHGTTNMQDFKDCDLIVEAAVENMDLKKKIFADIDNIVAPHAIISTNTSSMPITDIAMATKRPDKVMGFHFFNPVPVMRLLELVKTIMTSDETISIAREFGKSIGKDVVLAQDSPAFIVNRLLIPYMCDAIKLLEEGYATKEDIDTAVKLGLNYPMGPFELSDFVGLDTLYYAANGIFEGLHEPRYAPPLLLKKMVIAGLHGRKSGKGFYDYTKK
jgi:3-hydroxybutyryl-CoA dehydrogenase